MLRRSLPTAILAAFAALLIGGLIMALPNPASDAGPTLELRSGVSGVSGSNAAIATRPGTAQPDIAPAPAAPIPGAVTADTVNELPHDCPCQGDCGAAEQFRQQQH